MQISTGTAILFRGPLSYVEHILVANTVLLSQGGLKIRGIYYSCLKSQHNLIFHSLASSPFKSANFKLNDKQQQQLF